MYMNALNFELKFYVTDSNTAKATSEIVSFRKTLMVTSVHFGNVLRSKVVLCESAHSEQCTKGVFIDNLPANIQSEIKKFKVVNKLHMFQRLISIQTRCWSILNGVEIVGGSDTEKYI